MVIPGFCEVFTHGRPWTEADYLALGVKGELIELIDGSLFVSLLGHGVESQIRSQLWRVLGPPADAVGLQVFGRICARIGRNRIERSSAKQGETLRSDQPFPFELSTDDLFAWRRR